MKFLVDLPLGGLAKWLRLCGLDAALQDLSPARAALWPPPSPGTYRLTRRPEWARRGRPDVLCLKANDPEGQLAEVLERLGLTAADLAPLSRCGECNEPLMPLPRESVLGLVPDYVFHSRNQFSQCPRCQRIYWPGSHPARITARLAAVIPPARPSPPDPPLSEKGASHGL